MTIPKIPQPKDFYQTMIRQNYSSDDFRNLTKLYLPIIGTTSLSLLMSLISGTAQTSAHLKLFDQINCSGANFLQARENLEAMLLLETYYQENYDLGAQYLYQVKLPMTPQLFFAEPLFSGLLLVKIGEHAYDQLVADFKLPDFSIEPKFVKISRKFNEVYHLNLEILNQEDQRIHGANLALQPEPSDFNFAFFMTLMNNSHLQFKARQKAEQILTVLHSLFGLSELELFQQAVDFARSGQTIDLDQLKQALEKQMLATPIIEKAEQTVKTSLEQENHNLSELEQQLIAEAEKLAPADYLANIRQQKGGFVVQNELDLLLNLQKKFVGSGAINILINYVLIIKENSTLTNSYVQKIANDWLQHGVVDAKSALIYIKKLNEQIKNSTTTKSRKRTKVHVEQVPEYFDQEQMTKKTKKAKSQDVEKLKQKLRSM